MDDVTRPSIPDSWWSVHQNAPLAEPGIVRSAVHGPELEGYGGVFALFRNGGVTVSCPPDVVAAVEGLLTDRAAVLEPEGFIAAVRGITARVIGPAYIGYAEKLVTQDPQAARNLLAGDGPAVYALQRACDPNEWDHGGSAMGQPLSGVFDGGMLAALAGYEVWGGKIAHISVITHPDVRGRGHGRSVVAHAAARAAKAGLLPQYRTLEANAPSIAVAEALGFIRYGCSVAVRLG